MHQTVEDERVLLDEGFEFEIPCDGPRAWPEALGDCDRAAEWVALKPCGHHRLFCDPCRGFYIVMMGHHASFSCTICGARHDGFTGFERIDKARA